LQVLALLFENSVLRKIFGPKRDDVTGDWRRLHNEELNDLYSSPTIIRVKNSRRMRCAEHVACMWESRRMYRILVGKPEGKIRLGVCGRIILRWIFRKWNGGGMNWIDLAQDRDR
jgi:hypothetical protein